MNQIQVININKQCNLAIESVMTSFAREAEDSFQSLITTFTNDTVDDEFIENYQEFVENNEFEAAVNLDYGLDNPNWIVFCEGISTGAKYRDTVLSFIDWHKANFNPAQPSLSMSLIRYFTHLYSLTNDDDSKKYSPTTLRSLFSVFKAFWTNTGRGNLSEKCPIIENYINHWEKGYKVRKAMAFTKSDIVKLMNTTNNEKTLLWKAYAVIGCAFAGRGCEIFQLEYDAIEKVTNNKGVHYYHIKFERSKASTTVSEDPEYHIVVGKLETQALTEYLQCFKTASDRKGRLFRKLRMHQGINGDFR